ncbi:DUF2079 domain-containing protein [Candidatus Uhrbacteria bacterium]|nr:DUF2079 domain-containing protein [Candidatus Uhrbacteria bacterium]
MLTSLITYYTVGIAVTLVAAMATWIITTRRNWRVPNRVVVGIIAIVPFGLLIGQCLKYETLHMYTDVSHWLQLLQGITITGRPDVLNQAFLVPSGLNYLSIHFVPLIYLLAIPFALFPFPQTIFILNVALMSSAAIPLYLLARHHTGDRRFALVMVAILFWYPTFQYITLYEFEMLRFAIPVLFWMIYCWEKQHIGLYWLFAVLAVLVREEVGLTVAMFGAYLAWHERRRTHGLATMALGVGAFFLITRWVMPALHHGAFIHIAAGWFSQFGNTPLEIVKGALTHPLLLMTSILQPIKLANIAMLFIPLLFLPLTAPAALVGIVANVGVGLLSGAPEHSSYMLYYVAPSVPFLFFALINGWPRLVTRLPAPATMTTMLIGVVIANTLFGPSPLSLQFWSHALRPAPFRTQNFHWSEYRVTDHHHKTDELIRRIPNDAIVSAEQSLAPRLYQKRGTMIFPQLETADKTYQANYVFIDKTNPIKTGVATVPGSWDGLRQNPQFYYDWVEQRPQEWELLRADDGYFLYRRKDTVTSEFSHPPV